MSSHELKPNTVIDLSGKSLQIGEYISNGATANVFRGQYDGKDVAIKAIREGAKGGFYSEFRSEAENLRRIWKNWSLRGFTASQVVPELHAADVDSEYPLIVEEFIDGKKLDHAMRNLS